VKDTRPTKRVPIELVKLRSATKAYLAILEDAKPGIVRLGDKGNFLSELCEGATKKTEWGTPAAIGMAVAELLGEA
jgi:hypothetical protein